MKSVAWISDLSRSLLRTIGAAHADMLQRQRPGKLLAAEGSARHRGIEFPFRQIAGLALDAQRHQAIHSGHAFAKASISISRLSTPVGRPSQPQPASVPIPPAVKYENLLMSAWASVWRKSRNIYFPPAGQTGGWGEPLFKADCLRASHLLRDFAGALFIVETMSATQPMIVPQSPAPCGRDRCVRAVDRGLKAGAVSLNHSAEAPWRSTKIFRLRRKGPSLVRRPRF
jgi:hypothetical protein